MRQGGPDGQPARLQPDGVGGVRAQVAVRPRPPEFRGYGGPSQGRSQRSRRMSDDVAQPIIIRRARRRKHGHHGGAWKVAYADFVTALMAFFMVMWLVTAVSKDKRAALFEYFKNPSMEQGRSVKPTPGANGPGGASTSPINLGGGLDAPRAQ